MHILLCCSYKLLHCTLIASFPGLPHAILAAIPLLCIIVDTNQRTKYGAGLGMRANANVIEYWASRSGLIDTSNHCYSYLMEDSCSNALWSMMLKLLLYLSKFKDSALEGCGGTVWSGVKVYSCKWSCHSILIGLELSLLCLRLIANVSPLTIWCNWSILCCCRIVRQQLLMITTNRDIFLC